MAKTGEELVRAQVKAKRSMIARLEVEIAALEALVKSDTRQVDFTVNPPSNHGGKGGK